MLSISSINLINNIIKILLKLFGRLLHRYGLWRVGKEEPSMKMKVIINVEQGRNTARNVRKALRYVRKELAFRRSSSDGLESRVYNILLDCGILHQEDDDDVIEVNL